LPKAKGNAERTPPGVKKRADNNKASPAQKVAASSKPHATKPDAAKSAKSKADTAASPKNKVNKLNKGCKEAFYCKGEKDILAKIAKAETAYGSMEGLKANLVPAL
jgi:hypothetical protein